jgi:cyanophycinase
MFRAFGIFLFSVVLTAAAPRGTLVIVGGGDMPQEVTDTFLRAAGGSEGAVIGVIPTATEDPEGAYAEWKVDIEKAGATMVRLDVFKREDASLPVNLETAKRCTGFWFTGGDQNRVGDKIVGTPLQQVILERYRGGAVVGGTSAGAAIMSQIMLTGEDRNGKEELSELGPGAYRTREGMGFLPDFCIVDQHFLRRSRENRLLSLMMDHPRHLGLGIDESTALIVKNGQARVLGQNAVMVLDPSTMKTKNGAFSNLKIHLLRKGQGIDLKTRKLLEPWHFRLHPDKLSAAGAATKGFTTETRRPR